MLIETPEYSSVIAQILALEALQIEKLFEMIDAGDTVPFIARYRKDKTGNLDEQQIREILAHRTRLENLHNAKMIALSGIDEQGKLTDDLREKILACTSVSQVEEIYKPYKLKKKTKAMIAEELGFRPVAQALIQGLRASELERDFPDLFSQYGEEEMLEQAAYIISADMAQSLELREYLKSQIQNYGKILSKKKSEKMLEKLSEKDAAQIPKFEIYADFAIAVKYVKSYQVLALNRGEDLGILTVKLEKDEKTQEFTLKKYAYLTQARRGITPELEKAFLEGYSTLFKSLENEIRSELKESSEDDAISSFQSNLESLLLTRPEYGKRIIAIDPGYAAGCKVALLDELGNPLHFDKVFLRSPDVLKAKIRSLLQDYNPSVMVVGNGTGSDDFIALMQGLVNLPVYVVNESGASVYSASKVAAEEFPDLDSLDRGTVSIGRRFLDPLSELVKIPVESIGVGMYQHDMPKKKLEEKLGYSVEDVVNQVGVNVNTASVHVLKNIAGLDARSAKKVYKNRPYGSREELRKQLSEKAYEQAIGFLRVPDSPEELDNTDIHPEQYTLARYALGLSGDARSIYASYTSELLSLYPELSIETLEFVLESYRNLGKEVRKHSSHILKDLSESKRDVQEGDVVSGVVRNVVDFGAFVDIGLKNDGLVHISQIVDRYLAHPSEELEVGQRVRVKVLSLDNGKVQLSIKQA